MSITQADLAKAVIQRMTDDQAENFAIACLVDLYIDDPAKYVEDCHHMRENPADITYRVGVREVHISIREVKAAPLTSNQDIIALALDEECEVEMEYSHVLDSANHTVEIVK